MHKSLRMRCEASYLVHLQAHHCVSKVNSKVLLCPEVATMQVIGWSVAGIQNVATQRLMDDAGITGVRIKVTRLFN